MADIALSWDSAINKATWTMTGSALTTGNELETQILISIFTDRMAQIDDDIPDGTGDPRGWWGDDGEDVPIGSRLWMLDRSKQTQDTLQKAYSYVAEALQWLIDDKVVARFDIGVEWVRRSFLGVKIVAYYSDGSNLPIAMLTPWKGAT